MPPISSVEAYYPLDGAQRDYALFLIVLGAGAMWFFITLAMNENAIADLTSSSETAEAPDESGEGTANDEEVPACAVCGKRPAEADGLCGPCYRWEEGHSGDTE